MCTIALSDQAKALDRLIKATVDVRQAPIEGVYEEDVLKQDRKGPGYFVIEGTEEPSPDMHDRCRHSEVGRRSRQAE